MFKKIMYSIHRVLGTIISLLFLMWFVTGLVLVYHSFPDVTAKQKNTAAEIITDSLPHFDDVLKRIPDVKSIKSIKLNQREGQTVFTVVTKEDELKFCADSAQSVKPLTLTTINDIAKSWVDAPIAKIDTLQERDIWTMYTKYIKELPIYKVHFADKDNHQLYISSQSGDVQQFTSGSQRMWAYVGSIPHKFYFPVLRKHMTLWIDTITITSIIALIAVLSGIIIGVRAYIRSKRGKLKSPYRKSWYKWHHILGMIFGLFLTTWAISGVVSLKKIPQWMAKTHVDYKVPSKIKGTKLNFDKYKLDYRELKEKYPDLKQIEWTHFQNVPIYKIVVGDEDISIDASQNEIKELYLSEVSIDKAIKGIHGNSVEYTITLIDEFDEYYLAWKREILLPVYKVEVVDADNSLYYINPKIGTYKYVNNNRKVRKWLFNGFHYFHIKWLYDRPVLWTITIWTLSLGGILVSATGVWLGVRFVRRKIKRNFTRKKNLEC